MIYICKPGLEAIANIVSDDEVISPMFNSKLGMAVKLAPLNYLLFTTGKRFYFNLTVEEIENLDYDDFCAWRGMQYVFSDGQVHWNYGGWMARLEYKLTYNRTTKEIIEEKFPDIYTVVY